MTDEGATEGSCCEKNFCYERTDPWEIKLQKIICCGFLKLILGFGFVYITGLFTLLPILKGFENKIGPDDYKDMLSRFLYAALSYTCPVTKSGLHMLFKLCFIAMERCPDKNTDPQVKCESLTQILWQGLYLYLAYGAASTLIPNVVSYTNLIDLNEHDSPANLRSGLLLPLFLGTLPCIFLTILEQSTRLITNRYRTHRESLTGEQSQRLIRTVTNLWHTRGETRRLLQARSDLQQQQHGVGEGLHANAAL